MSNALSEVLTTRMIFRHAIEGLYGSLNIIYDEKLLSLLEELGYKWRSGEAAKFHPILHVIRVNPSAYCLKINGDVKEFEAVDLRELHALRSEVCVYSDQSMYFGRRGDDTKKDSYCPLCGSLGVDLVFKFECFNESCQNYVEP